MDQLQLLDPVWFFVAMAVLPALGFPLLPFALAAGPAYGTRLGVPIVAVLAIAAVAVNSALSYLLARSVLQQPIQKGVAWLGYTLPAIEPDTAWNTVVAVRLAPGLPYWIQSYALGLARVAWLPYLVGSTLVPAVYLCGAIVCGEGAWRGGVGAVFMGVGLLAFAVVATNVWRIRRARAQPAGPPAVARS